MVISNSGSAILRDTEIAHPHRIADRRRFEKTAAIAVAGVMQGAGDLRGEGIWPRGRLIGREGTGDSGAAPYLRFRLLLPRLDFMLISGQRVKTDVVRPPRGVNSPRTTHHSGFTAATMSRRILLTAFS